MKAGTRSFAFSVPESAGGGISYWRFTSERKAWGLEFNFNINGNNSAGDPRAWTIGVGPALKNYFTPTAKVAPFLLADLNATYSRNSIGDVGDQSGRHHSNYGVGAGGALGVDWFATDAISLGITTGLRFSVNKDTDGPTFWSFGTRTSELMMHIYF